MAFNVMSASTWQEAKSVYVNDGGTWRFAKAVARNTSGTWRHSWMHNATVAISVFLPFYGTVTGSFGLFGNPIDVRTYTMTALYYRSNDDTTYLEITGGNATFSGWTNASYAKDIYVAGGTGGSRVLLTDSTLSLFVNQPSAGTTTARFVWTGDVLGLVALAGLTIFVQKSFL